MVRILGLDVGDKRIGIALSDPLGMTAQTLEVIVRSTQEKDMAHIQGLIQQYQVNEIVIGWPLNMNGTIGPRAKAVEAFEALLRGHVSVPIVRWDERLSSLQGERILLEADMSRRRRKQVIDKVAASCILQSYLDWKHQNR